MRHRSLALALQPPFNCRAWSADILARLKLSLAYYSAEFARRSVFLIGYLVATTSPILITFWLLPGEAARWRSPHPSSLAGQYRRLTMPLLGQSVQTLVNRDDMTVIEIERRGVED